MANLVRADFQNTHQFIQSEKSFLLLADCGADEDTVILPLQEGWQYQTAQE